MRLQSHGGSQFLLVGLEPAFKRLQARIQPAALFEIGSSVYARLDLVKLAMPTLERLSSATQETVQMSVRA